mmetsp:Transcript_14958/g.27131  ORF Transcript_14958/g.27131 Transcript_14958/m.27131 type:complete len:266 (-) Transcript_14958:477-1274(-)
MNIYPSESPSESPFNHIILHECFQFVNEFGHFGVVCVFGHGSWVTHAFCHDFLEFRIGLCLGHESHNSWIFHHFLCLSHGVASSRTSKGISSSSTSSTHASHIFQHVGDTSHAAHTTGHSSTTKGICSTEWTLLLLLLRLRRLLVLTLLFSRSGLVIGQNFHIFVLGVSFTVIIVPRRRRGGGGFGNAIDTGFGQCLDELTLFKERFGRYSQRFQFLFDFRCLHGLNLFHLSLHALGFLFHIVCRIATRRRRRRGCLGCAGRAGG